MMKRLALSVTLLALTTACTEEVGLIDEDSNFGGRGGGRGGAAGETVRRRGRTRDGGAADGAAPRQGVMNGQGLYDSPRPSTPHTKL